jgi:hypothetical protein
MCYKIDSEVVIANFFAECEGINELKLSTLTIIKDKIEEDYKSKGKYLFIDTSRRSILNAVFSNPKYFSLDESRSKIFFDSSKINELYEDVYFIFNSKIDLKIKFSFLEILEKNLEEFKPSVVRQ